MSDDQVWKNIKDGNGISKDIPKPEVSPGTSIEQRTDKTTGVRKDRLSVNKEKRKK